MASVVLNLALCIPLSDRYGALGAAIAYAVPVSLLHAGLWLFELYDLVRYKLERSPLLRQAMDDGGWNILKSDHLRTWLASDRPDLAALEPLLGLDPLVERSGEQMPLFGGG